jgi:hypothetical protein
MLKSTKSKSILLFLVISLYLFQGNINAQDYDFEQLDDQFGLVVMEAEHYSDLEIQDQLTSWDSIFAPEGFSGTSAMQAVPVDGGAYADAATALNNSPIMIYKIKFVTTGAVYIWVRECHESKGDDSFHAGLDDEIPATSERIAFGADSLNFWYWISQNMSQERVYVIATEGVHEFKVYIRECGLKIDKFVLTTSADYLPSEEGPPETLPSPSVLESIVSQKFGLNKNYPNPFNSSTTISYDLNNADHVSLNVYNVLGHKVATLVDDFQNAGRHEFIWNANDENNIRLADGIYFIHLKAGSQNSRMRILLMQ